METEDFYDLTEDMVDQLRARIPERYLSTIKGAMTGGEYLYVVEDLVFAVAHNDIPITAAERDSLYRLVNDMRDNEDLLAKLGGVRLAENDD